MNCAVMTRGRLGTSLLAGPTSRLKKRFFSSEESERQSRLFALEKKRQREQVGRIEKIEVECALHADTTKLIMNRNLSTPFDCAKHFSENVINNAAVALIDGEKPWHMHKPLPDSCRLEFLHFNQSHVNVVNKAFWRTCSFLLGATAYRAFKEDVNVQLHSFPIPNVKSGSFVYDIQLSIPSWKPTENELRTLSLEMKKFCQQNHPIECIDVSAELALLIFESNPHKTYQIPDIAANNNGTVTLFRAGTHVDISKGPMVADTSQIGRVTVSNVIRLDTDVQGGPVYRFQGVALPANVILSHFAYGLLEERAKNLNPARIPGSQDVTTEENTFVAHGSN